MKHRKRKNESSVTWDCRACNLQMVGGPRCFEHNPLPEQREASPQAYRAEKYAPSAKQVR